MELLVLPDPHEGLADERPDVTGNPERLDPARDRLLPIGNGDDLLSLEGEEPELLTFEVGPACILRS